jgi:hypothetical protein
MPPKSTPTVRRPTRFSRRASIGFPPVGVFFFRLKAKAETLS